MKQNNLGSKFWFGWLLVGVVGETVAIRQDKRLDVEPLIALPTFSAFTRSFVAHPAAQVAFVAGWCALSAWFPSHIIHGVSATRAVPEQLRLTFEEVS